jgi:dolichol-phosphate mannosyltransferase
MVIAPTLTIVAVVPCYRSKELVLGVIGRFGPEITHIVCVDDACPLRTGEHISKLCRDPRVVVITHEENQGVGGAVTTGYRVALEMGADIVVKVDSDGQMDPAFVSTLIMPISSGLADYTKGNRFFQPEDLQGMPLIRKIGNAGLSFLSKFSSGYWHIFDPTNGFTAIHRTALSLLPLNKISNRFFFESDMLFRLNTIGAVVVDVPLKSHYGEESSNLSPARALIEFSARHIRTIFKRIAYMYFIRDFSVASLHLVLGAVLLAFGVLFGGSSWYEAAVTERPATAGTVMLAALPIILGFQMLLSFLAYDYAAVPRIPIQSTSRRL